MASIGIIVNPFSGKDLRRVTSNASVVTNQEKANKVFRMILSMSAFGIDKVWLMPDIFSVNDSVVQKVNSYSGLDIDVEVLPFEPYGNYLDTMRASEEMEKLGVGCIIVLGGDGTSRLVARTGITTPVLSISTGTNNAYPQFWEGTTAGIAASYVALHPDKAKIEKRDKSIKIVRNGEREEIAIVDAVITSLSNIGTKVVKDIEDIHEVFVCLAEPHMIGFSSFIGSLVSCTQEMDEGFYIKLIPEGKGNLAPVNSGELTEFDYEELVKMPLGKVLNYKCEFDGSVALDGERTMLFEEGDTLEISIERGGLYQVNVRETLQIALENGFMKVQK